VMYDSKIEHVKRRATNINFHGVNYLHTILATSGHTQNDITAISELSPVSTRIDEQGLLSSMYQLFYCQTVLKIASARS
jgi:hypothetical protein